MWLYRFMVSFVENYLIGAPSDTSGLTSPEAQMKKANTGNISP